MSKLPNLGPSLQRYLRQQARTAQRQQQSSAFNLSGASVTAEGVVTVDGELDVTGAMVVGGTLSLPAGIINNDALTSPLVIDSSSVQEMGFNVVTAGVDNAVGSIPVPAGFSRALVFLIVTAEALNSTAVADNLYVSAVIGADVSRSMPVQCGAAGGFAAFAPVTSAKASVLTGLSGGSIYVAARVSSQVSTWAANAGNRATTEATAIFLR